MNLFRTSIFILLCGMALSRPLWDVSARSSFPVMPLFSDAYRSGGGFDTIVTALVLVFGVFASIFPARKWAVAFMLLCLCVLCIRDLNRLQPWVWFSALLSLVFLLSKKEYETREATVLLLAGVYAWGGFHKMTPYFTEDNFAWFCEAFDFTKPLGRYPQLGYGLAVFEFLLGPGLLWRKTRRFSAAAGFVFHLLIIAALSPLGLDWNAVVIPWNAGMAWLLVLFCRKQESDVSFFKGQLADFRQSSIAVVLAAVWLAPVLNFVRCWPDAFSWKLYTNTQTEVTFYSKSIRCDPKLEAFRQKNSFDGNKMLLDDWANAELKTPAFSSERTFKQLGRYLCGCVENPDSAGLYILRVKPWNREAETLDKIGCSDLNIR
jgi:hypothetical protein